MSKSSVFLNKLQSSISKDCAIIENRILIDKETSNHINNILELIKHNKFGELNSYLNDEILYTPNKNYSYKVRDKISDEILNHNAFIAELENDD